MLAKTSFSAPRSPLVDVRAVRIVRDPGALLALVDDALLDQQRSRLCVGRSDLGGLNLGDLVELDEVERDVAVDVAEKLDGAEAHDDLNDGPQEFAPACS